MSKTQKPSNGDDALRPDVKAEFDGYPNTGAVLRMLWKKTAPTLTPGELAGVANGCRCVGDSLDLVVDMLNNVSSMDADAISSDQNMTTLQAHDFLWPLVDHLQSLSALSFVASDAMDRLLEPSVYREGGGMFNVDQRAMGLLRKQSD